LLAADDGASLPRLDLHVLREALSTLLRAGDASAHTFHNVVERGGKVSQASGGIKGNAVLLTNSPVMSSTACCGGGGISAYGPQPGSPALDAVPIANCPLSTDQRGQPRPDPLYNGACDSGAVEVLAVAPPATPTRTPTNTPRPTSTAISRLDGVRQAIDQCREVVPIGTGAHQQHIQRGEEDHPRAHPG
jgi:hypothetical protein